MPSRLVLVIEDDLVLLELVTSAFTDHGFTAHGARLLIEAQRLLADLRFDLVIIDMALPDGTGLEFITWLRSLSPERGRDTACIAITGRPSFAPAATAARFRATLQKPLELQTLVRIANDVLTDTSPRNS